jgi:hypothetical protein
MLFKPRSQDSCTLTQVVPQVIISIASRPSYSCNLDGINNGEEKLLDHTKVQMFLNHVWDPHYKIVIEVIKKQTGQGSLRLIQLIGRLRKCELELIQDRKSKRPFGSPVVRSAGWKKICMMITLQPKSKISSTPP